MIVMLKIAVGYLQQPTNQPYFMNILNRKIKESLEEQKLGEQCILTDEESTLLVVKTDNQHLSTTLDTITKQFTDPIFNRKNTTSNSSVIRIDSIPYLSKQYLLKKIANVKSEYHQQIDYSSMDREIPEREMKKFINEHYSSNIMDMVVIGAQDIKGVEREIAIRISRIKNQRKIRNRYGKQNEGKDDSSNGQNREDAFSRSNLGQLIIHSNNWKASELSFIFPLKHSLINSNNSSSVSSSQIQSSIDYICTLMGSEDNYSLLHWLKQNQKGEGVKCGSRKIGE